MAWFFQYNIIDNRSFRDISKTIILNIGGNLNELSRMLGQCLILLTCLLVLSFKLPSSLPVATLLYWLVNTAKSWERTPHIILYHISLFPKNHGAFHKFHEKSSKHQGFYLNKVWGQFFVYFQKLLKPSILGKKISIATPPSFAIFFCGCDRHGNACPQLASSCWHHTSSLGMIFPLIFGQICAAKEMEKSPRRCT